ncbi:MAG: UTP--glucose-1-phosphate uridylyltransferase GalU [Candidatus Caldatribacteriaceae bacterium]
MRGGISKAVIPVAGFGTRLLPVTKTQPKEMLPLVDRPAVQYVVEEAISSGMESILFVTGRGKRAIEDYFDYALELENELQNKGREKLLGEIRSIVDAVDIYYVRQKLPRGLGDAVSRARSFVGQDSFAVLLADDIILSSVPCLSQMLDLYSQEQAVYIAAMVVPPEEVSQWGIIKGREVAPSLYLVEDLVEKPTLCEAPSNLAIVGRYILKPSIFEAISQAKPGKGGEIQLTDALKSLLSRERMYAYCFSGRHFGVGDKMSYLKANLAFALQREEFAVPLREFLQELLREAREE